MNVKEDMKRTVKRFLLNRGYTIERINGVAQLPPTAMKSAQHSQQRADVFTNDFQFNMFVESNLDIEVKRKIIAQTFFKNVGYYPNINNPHTYSEKVLWLKLYYNDPLISKCCDKVGMKEYVDAKLGSGYTVPIIKVYDDVFDIDLDELPDQFALKVNWATGCNLIIKNKKNVKIDKVRAILERWTLPWETSYYGTFNRGYRRVKPVVFAEEYMDIPENSIEYKAFCFNGKVKFTLIELGYFGKKPKRAYYDRQWNEVPYYWGSIDKVRIPQKPHVYDEIVKIAGIIAEPIPYVRVDFYDIHGHLYVGELTFYSGGGFSKLNPREWDYALGDDLDISEAMKKIEAKAFGNYY